MNADAQISADVAIVGAGICGLVIAWRLAQNGRKVVLLDRAEAGRQTTWAAAGMLAARAEAEPGEEALLPLLLEAQEVWPGFAAELEAASGLGIGYRSEGTLIVARDRDELEWLEFQFDYKKSHNLAVEWLSSRDTRRREPYLTRRVTAGLYSPNDHQVDNRAVAAALRQACLSAGVELRENCEVREIVAQGGRVAGIATDDDRVAAESVVIAAGPWSRNIPGLPENARPPVRPVKGQMMAVQMAPEAPLLSHVVWTQEGYLVPRRDGRLILGGTVEELGFDTDLTAGGLYEVLKHGWETLPGIYELPLAETWVGLRPTSRDDAPILGPTPMDGLLLATGHHRNGILLAPLTGQVICDYLTKGKLPDSAAPFTLSRFQREPSPRRAAHG